MSKNILNSKQKITYIIDRIRDKRSYSINEICKDFNMDHRTLKKYLKDFIEIRSKKNKLGGKKRKTLRLQEKYRNAFDLSIKELDMDQMDFMIFYLNNKPL